ncbi:MAG TPA: inositol monophosphatase family protein [Acidimicrobiales bacterium]|nr:inositol monophosphatase family protein [Acidimicrobiales bacterium]
MDPELLRQLLCELGTAIRDEVIEQRAQTSVDHLRRAVGQVAADVTYGIDRIGEARVLAWLEASWPAGEPVRLVMEGIEDDQLVVFPTATPPEQVAWLCIVDPIDGTRNLMHDKRSGWALAAVAPTAVGATGWPEARLGNVVACAMTEIPTTRQWRADQFSCTAGGGVDGIVAVSANVLDGSLEQVHVAPTTATDLAHGFASFFHALPDGKAHLVDIEQKLWDRLWPPGDGSRPIFEDQYLCSAGQIAEVLCGRDRLVGDLRPLVTDQLSCHPYDICIAMLLTEAGGVFVDPLGGPVDCPLDTTSPVAWVAYANQALADLVGPALADILRPVR